MSRRARAGEGPPPDGVLYWEEGLARAREMAHGSAIKCGASSIEGSSDACAEGASMLCERLLTDAFLALWADHLTVILNPSPAHFGGAPGSIRFRRRGRALPRHIVQAPRE